MSALRPTLHGVALLALFGVATRAFGQDAPEAAPSAGPVAIGEGWGWVRAGPVAGGPMSDVAAHPTEPGVYAVAGLSGEVWLTLDAGETWTSVLPAIAPALGELSVEEEVQLEVEARIEELVEDVDLDDVEDLDPDDYADDPEALRQALEEAEARAEELAEQAEDAARAAADEVQTELQADPWFLEQQEVLDGRLEAARPRVAFTSAGGLAVARADGLWLSRDLGATWARPLRDLPVTTLLRIPGDGGGAWLAGTTDGLRYAPAWLDPWLDRDDGTEGLRILALASDGDTVYAGTDRGLWRAVGGQWAAVPGLDAPVLAILPDPDWPGGVWVATPRTILRSDDRGDTLREPLGAPIPGVRGIVSLGAGQVLVAGTDGVWSSVDGGTTWTPLARGLADPDTRALARQGDTVLLASDEGLLRLAPADQAVGEPVPDDVAAALRDFAPIDLLLDAALGRPELTARIGSRWGSTFLPSLTLEGRAGTADTLLYEPDTGSTRQLGGWWQALVRLQWTPAGQQARTVMVYVDGEDTSVLDGSAQAPAIGALDRGATAYRSQVAARLTELHAARAELVGSWRQVRRGSVLDQTLHALRVAELEAQIDALTDGAVSRWRHQDRNGG